MSISSEIRDIRDVGPRTIAVPMTPPVDGHELFRRIVEGMPQGAIALAQDDSIASCNPSFSALAESTQADMVGFTVSEFIKSEPDDVLACFLRDSRLGPAREEFTLKTRSGREVPVQLDAFPLPTLSQADRCVIVTDLSEMKLAGRLRESEERFRQAADVVQGMVYYWNLRAARVYCSAGLKGLIGYAPHETDGTAAWWLNRIHPEDRQRVNIEGRQALTRPDGRYMLEYRVQHREGHYVHVLDRGRVQIEADGTPIQVVGTSVDVSYQKETQKAVEEARTMLEMALESARMVAFEWDPDTGRLVHSANAREVLGTDVNTLDAGFDIVHPDDRAGHQAILANAMDRGLGEYVSRFRLVRPDNGQIKWVESHGRVMPGPDGSVARVCGVLLDIDERKQTEERLAIKHREVEALNASLQRSMAETHHRIKNNLQIVAALLDMQIMDGQSAIPATEITRLGHHVRSLAQIHDLLTTQAASDGDEISARTAIEKLLPLVQSVAGDRKICFEADEARLPVRQCTSLAVLINELISNAVKHGSGEIRLTFSVANDMLRLEVSDQGPGFPPDFDPDEAAHTGLELIQSLSRWDLQGDIQYSNAPGGGAKVVVQFPIPPPIVTETTHEGL